ncbi:hypothetical protein R3W88_016289 [Solanum pinnatisectum]|uniref:Uncharacterized protein n=1 Tax=Solanum pinnatisectum TaxID=50273 RepID=A0AAV9KXD9_9SOLN|nr:hypothetical protein R3W88_016289 [Solanum pinnatisectum]
MRYIIYNLLWMSHPNTLTLSIPTSFFPTAYFKGDHNCCSGTHEKCWRFFTHFEVKEVEEKKK